MALDIPRSSRSCDDMAYIFLRIKYPAKMVDHLVDRLRYVVSQHP